MKTYGRIWLDHGSGPWKIECPAHTMLRLKRVFERISKGDFGTATLSDTPENARELLWFTQRFPMECSAADAEYLVARGEEHERLEARIEQIVQGHYEFRGGARLAVPLREYQQLAAALLIARRRMLLADDVGLGKTASSIGALVHEGSLPAIVVTLAHLPRQWQAEIERFAPNLRCRIIKKGTPYDLTRVRGKIESLPDVIITNYHKLTGWAETLAEFKPRLTIFDEVQELRHDDSHKYRAAKHLADKSDAVMALSATPIFNYGGEIYSVLNVVAPGSLGSRAEFEREWCNRSSGERAHVADPQAFGTWLRDQGLMLRRTRAEVGRELPGLTKIPHQIESDPEALEAVRGRATELARIILMQGGMERGEKLRASEELSWRLRQATGIAKAPFVAEFVRMLVESGEKVVLYGWHREVYNIWQERLADLQPVFYTGEESGPQKDAAKQQFVTGGSKVLIISLRSGAGLDGLQYHARTVVFGELDWSPAVHEQCEGRIFRDGQADPVMAYYLLANSGSDPVIADVLGVKKGQIYGMRDPTAPLLEKLDTGEGHVTRLAEAVLRQHRARAA